MKLKASTCWPVLTVSTVKIQHRSVVAVLVVAVEIKVPHNDADDVSVVSTQEPADLIRTDIQKQVALCDSLLHILDKPFMPLSNNTFPCTRKIYNCSTGVLGTGLWYLMHSVQLESNDSVTFSSTTSKVMQSKKGVELEHCFILLAHQSKLLPFCLSLKVKSIRTEFYQTADVLTLT